MSNKYNEQFKPKHVAPHAGNDGTTDFPMDDVIRRLDGEEDEPKRSSEFTMRVEVAMRISGILQWIKSRDARPDEVWRRVHILDYWVSRSGTQAMLAERIGLSKGQVSTLLRKLDENSLDKTFLN